MNEQVKMTAVKVEPIQAMTSLKTPTNYLHNFLAAGVVFAMLVVSYNWKDWQNYVTKGDIVTHSVTILGDDGKPQWALTKYGLYKVDGDKITKVIDNVASSVEVNASTVSANKVQAKNFEYIDANGKVTKIQEHLYVPSKPVGDFR